MTLRKVAQALNLQYTYLSKLLRQDGCHLSEDHLFKVCKYLGCFPQEIDYIFLLRARETATDPERKDYIESRLKEFRQAHPLNAETIEFDSAQAREEMDYLFDPYCLLVAISLDIPEYFSNPHFLCALLGISPQYLRKILERLGRLQFIQFEEGTFRIEKLLKRHFHYGLNHPFMRAHQQLLRNMSGSQMMKVEERSKYALMVTFSGDEETFRTIREKYQHFLKDIETIALKAKRKRAYQMNFELHPWF